MKQQEFLQIISPFKDKLFRLAKRMLLSTEEAEDATQEVLLKLWNRNDNLKTYNSVEALAMTMTKNYCLDQLKSKRASNLKIVHTNFTDREAGLDQKMEDQDSWSWVEKIINDSKMKRIFILLVLIHSIQIIGQNNNAENRIIKVDFKKEAGKLNTMFKECIGAGRANEGLRADWQQQLALVKE